MCRAIVIIFGFCLFFGNGCGPVRTLGVENSGAGTVIDVCTLKELQDGSQKKDAGQVSGRAYAGDVRNAGAINVLRIWRDADTWELLHEFCHVIDLYKGDAHAALISFHLANGTVSDACLHDYNIMAAFAERAQKANYKGPLPYWHKLMIEYGDINAVQHEEELTELNNWPWKPFAE